MATTTNYNWATPDDTDLVKDGAAAIRTLGSAIDTTVFNNAGAAVAKSLIDAEGDLIVGDAADAVQRLAIGSNGNVLTVDTAVDGKIKWAAPAGSGMVLINKTDFTASAAVNVNDVFSATYDVYRIILDNVESSGAGTLGLRLRVGGADLTTAGVYRYGGLEWGDNVTAVGYDVSGTSATFLRFLYLDGAAADRAFAIMDINAPFATSITLTHNHENRFRPASTPIGFGGLQHGGVNNTTSYTGFSLVASANNFTGTVRTYGLQNS